MLQTTTGERACGAASWDANIASWLQGDEYSCHLISGHTIISKPGNLDEVFMVPSDVSRSQDSHFVNFFHKNETTGHFQLWTAPVSVSHQGPQRIDTKQLVWSRSLGQVEKIAAPKINCKGKESLISRKDGSILRSLCLDGFVAVITTSNSGARNILILSVSEGSLLHVQKLPESASEVNHLLIDNNKVVLIFEETVSRRTVLSLIELFTEHRSINRLVALASRVGFANPADDMDIRDGEIKVFHETFALDARGDKISSVAFTQTSQRVTPQTLILAVPSTEKLYMIPHKAFSARRSIPPTLEQYLSEGTLAGSITDIDVPSYDALIPLVPWRFIPGELQHMQDLRIECLPGDLESATLVSFPGKDVPPIPYYPALKYDSLSDDYSQMATISTLILLFGFVVYAFRQLLSSKSSLLWK